MDVFTLFVVLIYFFIMLLVAFYFSRKEKLETYFLNQRKTNLSLMTFSNVATLIGAGATIAIVSEVYNTGISYGVALISSSVVGAVMLGIMSSKIREYGRKEGIYTIVDFFEKRFDVKNKVLMGMLQMLLLFIWTGVQAVAIGALAATLLGIDYYLALILAATVSILYTSVGGMKVDIITDFIQFWIIAIFFFVFFFFDYARVGGIQEVLKNVPVQHLNLFNFGGASWFIAAIIFSGLIYVANSIHWQRILSAESDKVAKKAFYYTIPFMIIFAIIILFLGLSASVVLGSVDKEQAVFLLMQNVLPKYIIGFGFAAILAVIMSSVDSLLVGGSTIIYRAIFRKNQFENKKEILLARLITALFGIFSFLIAFLVPDIVTLSLAVGYLALILSIPTLFGLYSNKVSSDAAFYATLIPFVILVVSFPILGKNAFILPVILCMGIILIYDKIFKK